MDDLFSTFGSAGIVVVDSEEKYREVKLLDRTAEGAEELELDLTPSAIDKTNDPVRMYLREMGTVPLLTREGEVEIAKRIERGKFAAVKSISRTPTVAKTIIRMGEQLRSGDRTIRELITFQDEDLTDDRIDARGRQVVKQIESVRKARAEAQKRDAKVATILKRDKRKYRRHRWKALRARVELSQRIREIELTETVKRRMIDQIKEAVEPVRRIQGEIDRLDRQINARHRKALRQRGRSPRRHQATAGAEGVSQESDRRAGGNAGTTDTHPRHHYAGRSASGGGQEGARRSESPARRVDCQEVYKPRVAVPST